MIALRSFVVNQIYIVKKISNERDNKKSEVKIIWKWFLKIKYTADCNSQTVKETIKHANHSDKDENENVTPKKDDKKKSLNDIPQFNSPNRFDALQMFIDDNDKESEWVTTF